MKLRYRKYHHPVKYEVLQENGNEDFQIQVPIYNYEIDTEFLNLTRKGLLTIRIGYPWDGPSGPAFDTVTFMVASLVHDALYELLRLSLLPQTYRITADKIMRSICLEKGMNKYRAYWVYIGVRVGAVNSALPGSQNRTIEILEA
ncbi:unnamed protein product [marine sediment metagenome]|uniref:DUF1353 domain-containing protein n=1 Tax=marine sediment metagenome TaxID=412755 RepID=X0SP11_9ZZZZ